MYIRIADGVTRGMLKWDDWEGLTEKVRLELRLKVRGGGGLAKRTHGEEHSRQRDRA